VPFNALLLKMLQNNQYCFKSSLCEPQDKTSYKSVWGRLDFKTSLLEWKGNPNFSIALILMCFPLEGILSPDQLSLLQWRQRSVDCVEDTLKCRSGVASEKQHLFTTESTGTHRHKWSWKEGHVATAFVSTFKTICFPSPVTTKWRFCEVFVLLSIVLSQQY
jgi:hypothetical protein